MSPNLSGSYRCLDLVWPCMSVTLTLFLDRIWEIPTSPWTPLLLISRPTTPSPHPSSNRVVGVSAAAEHRPKGVSTRSNRDYHMNRLVRGIANRGHCKKDQMVGNTTKESQNNSQEFFWILEQDKEKYFTVIMLGLRGYLKKGALS